MSRIKFSSAISAESTSADEVALGPGEAAHGFLDGERRGGEERAEGGDLSHRILGPGGRGGGGLFVRLVVAPELQGAHDANQRAPSATGAGS